MRGTAVVSKVAQARLQEGEAINKDALNAFFDDLHITEVIAALQHTFAVAVTGGVQGGALQGICRGQVGVYANALTQQNDRTGKFIAVDRMDAAGKENHGIGKAIKGQACKHLIGYLGRLFVHLKDRAEKIDTLDCGIGNAAKGKAILGGIFKIALYGIIAFW